MDYRVAIVGPKKMTSGFKSLGVDVYDAEDGNRAVEVIKDIKKGISEKPYAVIMLMERLAEEISEEEHAAISKDALPAIVILPGLEGSSGKGLAKLKKLAERAVGSDILE